MIKSKKEIYLCPKKHNTIIVGRNLLCPEDNYEKYVMVWCNKCQKNYTLQIKKP